jgi:hypothetical protein
MTHHCPAVGCTVTDVPDTHLFCREDWPRVPKPLRQAVIRAYARGAGRGSPALLAAQQAAIRALNRDAKPPAPHELWQQAGGDPETYRGLMRQHGHLLAPGDEGYEDGGRNLSCGWPHRGESGETP